MEGGGVHGRILLLFDRFPHFTTYFDRYAEGEPLSDANFVEYAIFENIVRRLYWVVPEADWSEFRDRRSMYLPIREVPGLPGATYLNSVSGVPFVAVAPSSLPHPSEEVLAYVNANYFDPRQVAELLERNGIRCNLIAMFRRGEAQ